MKKCFAVLLCLVLLLCLLPIPARSAATNLISYAGVNDVIGPRHGNPPDTSAISAEPEKYTIKSISWAEYGPDRNWIRDLKVGDTFVMGYYYFAFIELKAADDYIFDNSSSLLVDGGKATFYNLYDGGERAEFFLQYDLCKKNIDKVELTIVLPVVGKTPTFARAEGEGYVSQNIGGITNETNGVTWTNQSTGVNLSVSNPFKEGAKYTVTYHLTARENYQFNGTKYYINGQQVEFKSSNMGQTEVVLELRDLVPDDKKIELSELALSVPAPKEGEKPDYTKLTGTGYYSDNAAYGSSTRIFKNGIAWYKSATSFFSPGTTETFEGGREYTLKLSLLPAEGYKFAKTMNITVNGKAAVAEVLADGSVTVSVNLTSEKKEHIHTPDDWHFDAVYHWKVCSLSTCGEMLTERILHNDADGDRFCDDCGFEVTLPPEHTVPGTQPTEPSSPTEPSTPSKPSEPTEPSVPTVPTEPTAPTTPSSQAPAADNTPAEKQGDTFPWWAIVLIAVAIAALSFGTTSLLLRKKR